MSEEREKAIRERAYALWERSGSQHGQHGEHWDQAVREIDAELRTNDKPARKLAAKPAAKIKPGPKPKPSATKAETRVAAKTKPAATTKAKTPLKPPPVAAGAVGKAKQAAGKVVETVKRATKGSSKK